ncbi:MAG: AAA family ATPase [Idiomarina sp.]|nr:AAA family ATPase [Idiomarina sp.]
MNQVATTNMPTALAVPVQIMPTQQKVLEQLHYLTTFRNHMVILAGPEGAGKSTLLEVFLEQASDYANVAYLVANPKLQPEHVRERLLQHISHARSATPDISLSKTIRRALPAEPQHLMIVVDDANTLAPVILDELQELVLHSRFTGGRHRISVVLSGPTEWAARQRKSLPSNAGDKPEILLIPELSDDETLSFSRSLLQGQAVRLDTHRLQSALSTIPQFPGLIQQQLSSLLTPVAPTRYQMDDDSDYTPTRKPTPAKRAQRAAKSSATPRVRSGGRRLVVACLVAMVVSAAAVSWLYQDQLPVNPYAWLQQSSSGDVAGNVTDTLADTLAENLAETTVETTAHLDTAVEPSATTTGAANEVANNEPTLHPVLEQGDTQLTMSFDEALAQLTRSAREFQAPADLHVGLMRVNDRRGASDTSIVESITEAPATQALATQEAVVEHTPAPEPAPVNPWLNAFDNATLWQADPSRYRIQLTAVSSRSALDRFLNSQVNSQNLMVYQTLRNERSWYVVVTGDYASLADARAAIRTLPAEQRALEPWAKPVEWIQNELRPVMAAP